MSPMIQLAICFFALPIFTSANRKFQNALSQQNIQSLLLSIDERLRNLDTMYLSKYPHHVDSKIDQNNRKLDLMESRIGRFEAVMDVHFDKMAENMSNQYFKEDIAKDHMLRKIDATYERMHHRLMHLEMRIEMGEKKIMDKLDLLMTRFNKMEDIVTTRESDIEEEIGEVLIALEEIKSTQVTNDVYNLTSFNHSLNNALDDIRSNALRQNEKLETSTYRLEGLVNSAFNDTLIKMSRKNEEVIIDINQILDAHEKLHQKNNQIYNIVTSIASVANLTRNEQQNGFRNLVVQVGRLGGKNNILNDVMAENSQLKKLSDKIDDNFKNIMILQNLFLESCHRIQMDETQLESKISEVLEKLIDTFEQKTSIEIKDIENLEQILKAHDTNIKRSLYATTHNMGVLLKKGTEGKDDIQRQLMDIENGIVAMNFKFDELKMEGSTQIKNIALLEKLEKLEQKLHGIYNKSEGTHSLIGRSIQLIENIQADLLKMSIGVAGQTETRDKHINDLRETLTSILTKLSIFEQYTNKTEMNNNSKIETTMKHPQTFMPPVKNITNPVIIFSDTPEINKPNTTISDNLESLINEAFGVTNGNQNGSQLNTIINFVDTTGNCTDFDIDVRNSGRNCSGDCAYTNNCTQRKIQFVDEGDDCTGNGIDIRSNARCNQSLTQNCSNASSDGMKKCNESAIKIEDDINSIPEKKISNEKIFFSHPNNDVLIDIRIDYAETENTTAAPQEDLQSLHWNLFNSSDTGANHQVRNLNDNIAETVNSNDSTRIKGGSVEDTNIASEAVWD